MARKVEARQVRKGTKAAAKTGTRAPAEPRKTDPSPTRRKTAPRAPARPKAPRKPRTTKPAAAPAPLPSATETLAHLVRLNRAYYDAFQSLDIEQVAKSWWHDESAICIHPGWDARHGWSSIRQAYEEIFSNTKSIRFALGDVHARVVGDLGYVFCVENLVSEEGDAGDYLGAVLATNVFERRRGDWRIIHHHASPFSTDEVDIPDGPLH